jgi:hypothetical protein
MTERDGEWETWQRAWLSAPDAPPDGSLSDPAPSLRAARHWAMLAELVQAVVAVGGLGLLGIAMRHAANVGEAALGLSVGLTIALTWGAHIAARRGEAPALAADAVGFLAHRRAMRHRQLRLVRFVWTVLTLDLVFCGWWWAGGIAIHRHALSSPIVVATLWIPLVAMGALAAWSAWLGRMARADLRCLERAEREFESS